MLRILGVLALLCSFGCIAYGQTPASADQTETIQDLVHEVTELKARLAALEAKQAQSDPVPVQATKLADPVSPDPTPTPTSEQPSTAEPLTFIRGIKFQGFGEAGYRVSDIKSPEAEAFGFTHGSSPNFSIGDFDLFLTSRINEKTSVLAELVFGQEADQTFDIDLERVLLKYDLNDYLKMSFGRFHTATSYYNSVFHSGKWLQTSIDRPWAVEFANDGGLLPTQAVGTSINGKLPSGKLGAGYYFEYGSAHTVRPKLNDPSGSVVDEQNGNGVTLGAYIKPDWLQGLELGGSVYHDRLNPINLGLTISQTIGSVHAVYITPKFEFINEAFLIRHTIDATDRTFNTSAFYSQISDNIAGPWRPYFRYDYVNAAVNTPIFSDIGLRHGPTAGVRYDFNSYVALKAEYARTYRRQLPTFNRAATQLAFRF